MKQTRIPGRGSLPLVSLVLGLVFFFACDDDGPVVIHDPDPLRIRIDTGDTHQTIAGFGGANRMWGARFLKPDEAQKAFGLGAGALGLSIFRIRIPANRTEWPSLLESAKAAQAHGVKILASPWSSPASLKSNNSDIGGYLLEENFAAFTDQQDWNVDIREEAIVVDLLGESVTTVIITP